MAATGYTPIQLYYSTTASNVPVAANLVQGELAINIADGKLYYEDSGGVVQMLASKDVASGIFTQVNITGQGDLRFEDSTGGEYVALQAPATVATSYTLTLPTTDGNANEVLTTDGSGVLSWTAPAAQVYPGSGIAVSNGTAWSTSIIDSAGLAAAISDETGSGALVFGTSPTLSGVTLNGDSTGNDGLLKRMMFQDTGWDYFDSNTTSALDYVNGSVQRWAPSGTVSLTVTNWPPSGALGELLIEGINLGAATITWPTVNWIKSDGTTTTTFASNGVTLQSSGTDWFLLWTRDGGTTVYGKFVR